MRITTKESSITRKWYPIYLTLPVLVIFFVFYFLPLLQGFWYSFYDWNGFTAKWIGFENFSNILVMPRLSTAFKNSFIFTFITSPFKIVLGFLIALAINRKLKTGNYVRTVIFSPVLLSGIAIGALFTAILHPSTGILNEFLRTIGLGFLAANWLTDTRIAMLSVCMIEIWKYTGFSMTIQLAGLQNIPREYYECAEIDGASGFKKHLHITLPLMIPTINNNVFLSLSGGLAVFDIVMASTGGGPGYTTSVINTLVYTSFGSGRYGEASAIQLVLGLITTAIVLIANRFIARYEKEVY